MFKNGIKMNKTVKEQETTNEDVVELLQRSKSLETLIEKTIKSFSVITQESIKQLYSDAESIRKTIMDKTNPKNPDLLYPENVVKALGVNKGRCYGYFSGVHLTLRSLDRKWGEFQAGTRYKPKHYIDTPESYLKLKTLESLCGALGEISFFQGCLKGKVPEYFKG